MKTGRSSGPFTCLVAMGDSITMGATATRPEYAWVSRLGRLLSEFQDEPLRVINAGISGNLISPGSRAYHHVDSGKPSGLERYRRDVIAFHPDLVTISYGLNDMRCGTPGDVFMAEMDLLVRGIRKETQAVIVLIGVYYMTAYRDEAGIWGHGDREGTQRYNARLQEYAGANELLYADVYSAQGEASWIVDKDGVHPNNLGHALIAHKVFEAIATHCRGMSLKPYRDAEAYPRWADAVESALRTYDGIDPEKRPT